MWRTSPSLFFIFSASLCWIGVSSHANTGAGRFYYIVAHSALVSHRSSHHRRRSWPVTAKALRVGDGFVSFLAITKETTACARRIIIFRERIWPCASDPRQTLKASSPRPRHRLVKRWALWRAKGLPPHIWRNATQAMTGSSFLVQLSSGKLPQSYHCTWLPSHEWLWPRLSCLCITCSWTKRITWTRFLRNSSSERKMIIFPLTTCTCTPRSHCSWCSLPCSFLITPESNSACWKPFWHMFLLLSHSTTSFTSGCTCLPRWRPCMDSITYPSTPFHPLLWSKISTNILFTSPLLVLLLCFHTCWEAETTGWQSQRIWPGSTLSTHMDTPTFVCAIGYSRASGRLWRTCCTHQKYISVTTPISVPITLCSCLCGTESSGRTANTRRKTCKCSQIINKTLYSLVTMEALDTIWRSPNWTFTTSTRSTRSFSPWVSMSWSCTGSGHSPDSLPRFTTALVSASRTNTLVASFVWRELPLTTSRKIATMLWTKISSNWWKRNTKPKEPDTLD